MTNKKYCNICEEQVSPSELKCIFCKHSFHIRCCKVILNDAAIVNKDNNIHWFCDQCNAFSQTDILIEILNKITAMGKSMSDMQTNIASFTRANQKIKSSVPSKEPSKKDSPAMNTRKKNAEKRSGSLIETSDEVPAKKDVMPITEGSIVENVHNKTFRDAVLNLGASNSNEGVEPIQKVKDPLGIEERRWIFVSRLNPNTSSENLSRWLKSNFKSDDIICFPLIPRGKLLTELRMISFKVGVPDSLLEMVKDRRNWFPGIQIRDFVIRTVSIPIFETPEENTNSL